MATNYKTADEAPDSWFDRCSGDGYERYMDEDGNRRYRDNGELVSDMPFRPCARCGEYPNERGDDHCIQNLGRVVNACCGHGSHDGYVMFDDGRILRGRFEVEQPEEPLPKTNFTRITESPEKLAEFIDRLISGTGCCIPVEVLSERLGCIGQPCGDTECQHNKDNCAFDTLEWLQEECDG